jgi:hypothetical protein
VGRLAMALGFVAGIALVALGGCGQRSDGRLPVSGTVRFQGKLLDRGSILFIPVAKGIQSGTDITNGSYSIAAAQGLPPGKYRVAITSGDGRTPVSDDALPGPSGNFSSKDRIPPKYNIDSKLEAEVTAAGSNRFDFPLKAP